MKFLRTIRYALWCFVAIVCVALGGMLFGWWGPGARQLTTADSYISSGIASIGGPFEMTDHKGRTVTERDLIGRPTLMFFGFTSCPEVCPTTLAEISAWLNELGASADILNAVFVSVDPERDTVEQMASYLELFDRRIVGLTGTPAQLERFARNYRFYYRRVPLQDGDYTMDHTALVYLLNREGQLTSTIDYHETRDNALPKLRGILSRRGVEPQ